MISFFGFFCAVFWTFSSVLCVAFSGVVDGRAVLILKFGFSVEMVWILLFDCGVEFKVLEKLLL